MHVGLDAKLSARSEILLRVSLITIAGLSGEPTVEVIAVGRQDAARVCRSVAVFRFVVNLW